MGLSATFDLEFPESRQPFVDALRQLPDWGVVLDDHQEPWFKVPMSATREGTVLPAEGVVLVGIDTEGSEVWVGEAHILEGTDAGCFTLTDQIGSQDELEQIDLTQLNDEE